MEFVRIKDITIDKDCISFIQKENNKFFLINIQTKNHGFFSVGYPSKQDRDFDFDRVDGVLHKNFG